MRIYICAAALSAIASIALQPIVDANSIEVVDQAHADPNAYELYHNIEVHEPIGQAFRTGIGAIDFVDVWLLDIGNWESEEGSLVKLILRANSLEGEVLSEAGPVRIGNGFDGSVRFVFDNRIQFDKEETYVIELIHMEGEPAAVRNYGDLFAKYERGNLFLKGNESLHSDMWFRTGVLFREIELIDVSLGGIAWLGVTPLSFEVWGSTNLVEWELVERVVSETNRYEFKYSNWSTMPQFFRVQYSQ